MSGRSGIYKGPYGDDLYGDGKEVETGAMADPQVRQLAEQHGAKSMWTDSIYFYHHFGHDPKGLPVYKSAELCRKNHKCIEMSEASPNDPSASCEALEVLVIPPESFKELLAAFASHTRREALREAEQAVRDLPAITTRTK